MPELDFLRSELLASVGIIAIFSERRGGISPAPYDSLNLGHDIGDNIDHVDANLAALIKATGIFKPPHQAEQEHGVDHFICTGIGRRHTRQADILLSSEPNTPIAVRTADCLPILMADPVNRIVAAVHAGWRGTASGVVLKAIEKMEHMGAESKHIRASLGPAIGPCCFEVGEDTAEQLKSSVSGADSAIKQLPKSHADLTAINQLQLKQAGVKTAYIEIMSVCTCCHPERFYSFRRDHGVTGRHLAVVALPQPL